VISCHAKFNTPARRDQALPDCRRALVVLTFAGDALVASPSGLSGHLSAKTHRARRSEAVKPGQRPLSTKLNESINRARTARYLVEPCARRDVEELAIRLLLLLVWQNRNRNEQLEMSCTRLDRTEQRRPDSAIERSLPPAHHIKVFRLYLHHRHEPYPLCRIRAAATLR